VTSSDVAATPRWSDDLQPVGVFARLRAMAAGVFAMLVTAAVAPHMATPYNNYVLFADALLHGHLWLESPGSQIDAVLWNGYHYIINDPVPGLLLVPAVARFGTDFNQSILAFFLCGFAIYAAWLLCERFGTTLLTTLCLVGFLFVGTDLLWCSLFGDVWFVAQTSAVCFTMFALLELFMRRRRWLVLLFLCLAVGSRFTVVMSVPVFLVLFAKPQWINRHARDLDALRKTLRAAALVLAPVAALWMAYNWARWGVPYDRGHTIFFHQDSTAGSPTGSPFGVHNLRYQLWSYFIQTPYKYPVFPWLVPWTGGVALTWTSPALLLAFWARRPLPLVLAMWAATLLVAAPNVLYYVNGYAQFGMRHALDFEPFLFVLMILAVRPRAFWLSNVLCVYSIAVGIWGVWFWRTFFRPYY
jgi:hypothetical protein